MAAFHDVVVKLPVPSHSLPFALVIGTQLVLALWDVFDGSDIKQQTDEERTCHGKSHREHANQNRARQTHPEADSLNRSRLKTRLKCRHSLSRPKEQMNAAQVYMAHCRTGLHVRARKRRGLCPLRNWCIRTIVQVVRARLACLRREDDASRSREEFVSVQRCSSAKRLSNHPALSGSGP
jgi:hypothetical protein